FDQFGLIVCGWSGAWDTSLRKAIKRCPARRYSTFWAVKGAIRPEAKELITKRDAKLIEIQDADKFFDDLKEKVRALEELHSPSIVDKRMATAMIKRYLAEDKYKIKLRDTVIEQTKNTVTVIGSRSLSLQGNWSADEFKKRLKFYEGET